MDTLTPTQEEARLLHILNDDWWQENATRRGVRDVSVVESGLTPSGVVAMLELQNEMTGEKLLGLLAKIRTLLNTQDDHDVQLMNGGRASLMALAVRTRRVTDQMDMRWRPGITTLGVDTVTGEEVDIAHDSRALIAGASGSGKSWCTRPLMARSVLVPNRKVVFIDGKGEEGMIWKNVCDVAMTGPAIIDKIDWLHSTLYKRQQIMAEAGISVWNTKYGPEYEVFVDEGRVVLAILSRYDKSIAKPEEGCEPEIPSLEKVIDLSSLGRSRGMTLKWATQYPVTSGANPGIDQNVNANVDERFCLRVKNPTQARVVLDDDACYGPDRIPATKEMRGHGYKGEHGPNLIRAWTVDDDTVRGLATLLPGGRGPDGPGGGDKPPAPSPETVIDSMLRNGSVSARQLSERAEIPMKDATSLLNGLFRNGRVSSSFNGRDHLYKNRQSSHSERVLFVA